METPERCGAVWPYLGTPFPPCALPPGHEGDHLSSLLERIYEWGDGERAALVAYVPVPLPPQKQRPFGGPDKWAKFRAALERNSDPQRFSDGDPRNHIYNMLDEPECPVHRPKRQRPTPTTPSPSRYPKCSCKKGSWLKRLWATLTRAAR